MTKHGSVERNAKYKQYLTKIGDNIRKIRNQRGYSQEEFAEMAGFSCSYYTEIETGKRNIFALNLIKIIKVLEVDPNELLDFLNPK